VLNRTALKRFVSRAYNIQYLIEGNVYNIAFFIVFPLKTLADMEMTFKNIGNVLICLLI